MEFLYFWAITIALLYLVKVFKASYKITITKITKTRKSNNKITVKTSPHKSKNKPKRRIKK